MNFMSWRSQLQTPITIESWRIHEELNRCVQSFLAATKISANTCYDNAMQLSTRVPSIGYVLGRVSGDDQTVDHAWNVWNGIHFDITREMFAPSSLSEFIWQKFVVLDANQLRDLTTFGLAPSIFDVFDRSNFDPMFNIR